MHLFPYTYVSYHFSKLKILYSTAHLDKGIWTCAPWEAGLGSGRQHRRWRQALLLETELEGKANSISIQIECGYKRNNLRGLGVLSLALATGRTEVPSPGVGKAVGRMCLG